MPIVGGLDIHRKQITFDYLDTVTGEVHPAGRGDVAFALEGCAGWRYVALRREALFVRVEVRDLRLRPVAAGR